MPNRIRMRAAVLVTVWFALSTYALSADIPTGYMGLSAHHVS